MELPVDHNKYTRLAKEIDNEIRLIKKWRASDNRFRNMVLSGDLKLSQESFDEEIKLISENPFTEVTEETLQMLNQTENSDSSEVQQINKGMPDRVFTKGSL
jgi:hypothetical protein